MPQRDDFAALYIKLRELRNGDKIVCREAELAETTALSEDTIRLMLDVFAELSFISIHRAELTEITMLPVKGKIPLENSTIYTRMKKGNSYE